jgi:major intracellular serine protease
MTTQDVRLIPYAVQNIETRADKVPEGINKIQAPALWEKGEKGKGIVVAVLDTGAQPDHPDLKDRIIGGYNFTTDDNGNPSIFKDYNGHGTHVAGTIAASSNGTGVVGVAPEAQLLILKVLAKDGSGSYSWIINAINYAANWKGPNGERVRVINMSLGGPQDVPQLHQAIKAAVEKDIAIVVAAGNEGDGKEETSEFAYPGAYPEVIEVAASTFDNKLANFSNNNNQIDVIAPGVNILSAWPGSRYSSISGTSMATPHVAGALALLISVAEKEFGRKLTEPEIFAILVKHTKTLGFKKSSEGHGLVQLDAQSKVDGLLAYIAQNF